MMCFCTDNFHFVLESLHKVTQLVALGCVQLQANNLTLWNTFDQTINSQVVWNNTSWTGPKTEPQLSRNRTTITELKCTRTAPQPLSITANLRIHGWPIRELENDAQICLRPARGVARGCGGAGRTGRHLLGAAA